MPRPAFAAGFPANGVWAATAKLGALAKAEPERRERDGRAQCKQDKQAGDKRPAVRAARLRGGRMARIPDLRGDGGATGCRGHDAAGATATCELPLHTAHQLNSRRPAIAAMIEHSPPDQLRGDHKGARAEEAWKLRRNGRQTGPFCAQGGGGEPSRRSRAMTKALEMIASEKQSVLLRKKQPRPAERHGRPCCCLRRNTGLAIGNGKTLGIRFRLNRIASRPRAALPRPYWRVATNSTAMAMSLETKVPLPSDSVPIS